MGVSPCKTVESSEARQAAHALFQKHVGVSRVQTIPLAPANVGAASSLHHEARSGPCSIVRGGFKYCKTQESICADSAIL